jgi:O-antigen/teichoic acid export membrane protein
MLSFVGRKLGIDAHYFAKNSLILTGNYALSVLSGLVTGYLVARLLPPEVYGGYRFVISVVSIVSLLTLPGMENAMAREVAQKGDKAAVRFTMFWNAALSLSGVMILLGIIPFLGFWHQETLWPLFLIASLIFIPLNIGPTFFSAIVTGTSSFRKALESGLINSILVILSVLTLLAFSRSPVALYGLVVGIPALVGLIRLRRALPAFPSTEKTWRVLRYALFLSINSIPFALAWYIDSLLVSALFGFKSLALLQVATLIPEQVKSWYKYLLPSSFARQANGKDSQERRRKLILITLLGIAIMTAGVILYVIAAPWLMHLLFPNYDAPSLVLLTRIQALSVITLPSLLLTQYFETQSFKRELRTTQWSTTLLYICTLVLLTPRFGPLGVVLSRLMYRISGLLLSFLLLSLSPLRSSEHRDRNIAAS